MKLIDLLVKELLKRGGWPEAANYVVQDYDGTVKFSKSINFLHIKAGEWCSNEDGDDWIYGDRPFEGNFHHYITANDWNVSIVTREQYKTALAASKAVIGHEGWIQWAGGKCPVDSDAIVEVKYRKPSPLHFNNDRAGDFSWSHDGIDGDIIAYRMQNPGIDSRANDDRLEQDLNECIGQDVDTPEWNGDGFPPVGTVCEYSLNDGVTWFKCKIDYILGTQGLVMLADVFEGAQYVDFDTYDGKLKFRPLRTEAERARDKLAASLHIAAGASPIELNGIGSLYFKLADAIISGSVFGTTFKAGK